MKKNRGFTLIELLAVIIILAGIALITFPLLLNQIKKSEGEIDSATKKLVLSAAKLYVDENLNDYPLMNGNTYCIPVADLISDNYLQKGVLEASKVDTNNKIVKVTVTEAYNYEVVNKDTCIPYISKTCNLVSDIGDVGISYGDEYSCDPGDGIRRTFYVLEDGDNTTLTKGTTGTTGLGEVSLIMMSNVGNQSAWAESGDNSEGAISAINYLKSQTTNNGWTVNVNLPTVNQIGNAAGNSDWHYFENHILPLWLHDNVWSGYWTSTPSSNNAAYGWRVTKNGTFQTYSVSGFNNVRPVITINKTELGL